MDLATIFISTFVLIFIGELGDKTQIAAGTGTLANQRDIRTIFLSSSLALVLVTVLTVFFAGLVPQELLPTIKEIGGLLLIVYGGYLYIKTNNSVYTDTRELPKKSNYGLFFSHFSVVFLAELGDKTQYATLAAAIKNQSHLLIVFTASATALVTVTAITVWGVTKIPGRWIKKVQQTGAALMMVYGAYMLYSPT